MAKFLEEPYDLLGEAIKKNKNKDRINRYIVPLLYPFAAKCKTVWISCVMRVIFCIGNSGPLLCFWGNRMPGRFQVRQNNGAICYHSSLPNKAFFSLFRLYAFLNVCLMERSAVGFPWAAMSSMRAARRLASMKSFSVIWSFLGFLTRIIFLLNRKISVVVSYDVVGLVDGYGAILSHHRQHGESHAKVWR